MPLAWNITIHIWAVKATVQWWQLSCYSHSSMLTWKTSTTIRNTWKEQWNYNRNSKYTITIHSKQSHIYT